MKLNITPRMTVDADTARWFKEIARQVNAISEGSIVGFYSAATAAPTGTAKTYFAGDRLLNSAPAEAGAGGSKYVITGWICTVGGTPGTWLAMRSLTGN